MILSLFSTCAVPPRVRERVQVRSVTASGTLGPKASGSPVTLPPPSQSVAPPQEAKSVVLPSTCA